MGMYDNGPNATRAFFWQPIERSMTGDTIIADVAGVLYGRQLPKDLRKLFLVTIGTDTLDGLLLHTQQWLWRVTGRTQELVPIDLDIGIGEMVFV